MSIGSTGNILNHLSEECCQNWVCDLAARKLHTGASGSLWGHHDLAREPGLGRPQEAVGEKMQEEADVGDDAYCLE